jgi:hypothetical protein
MNVPERLIRFSPKGGKGLRALFLKFLHKLFRLSSEKLNLFATYDIVELNHEANKVPLIKESAQVGIVIQGQIIPRTTLEICTFYKKIYPQVQIVLSTWEGEDTDPFKGLEDDLFAIIQSVKPNAPGPSNINMQITSAVAGINQLRDRGCSHILKTRTDMLLGNSSFLNYLIWMHSKGKQNALVFSSFNSFLFRLFSPTDQVMFGKAIDIARFWSIDLVPNDQEIDFPEKYLFKKYLKLNGYETHEELKNYLTALRDYAVIADHEQLGQIWNKGTYTALNFRWRGEKFPNRMTQLSSWHWEMLKDEFSYFEKLSNSLD